MSNTTQWVRVGD